jgi:hypothetical protein
MTSRIKDKIKAAMKVEADPPEEGKAKAAELAKKVKAFKLPKWIAKNGIRVGYNENAGFDVLTTTIIMKSGTEASFPEFIRFGKLVGQAAKAMGYTDTHLTLYVGGVAPGVGPTKLHIQVTKKVG